MKPTRIIVHHSGGTDANPLQDSSNYTVKMCNEDHRIRFNMLSSLGWWVGYHYVIEKNGKITQCRKDGEESAATVGHNLDAINIMLCGNFDLTLPTESQKTALRGLLESKMAEWSIPVGNIDPHRKFASKTCYGRLLPDDWAQKLVTVPQTKADTITPLRVKLLAQLDAKDWNGAKETCSYLFNELTKQ